MLPGCGSTGSEGSAAASSMLSGAGASFPLPYYQMVFKEYNSAKGVEVSYGAIGSGGGIRSLKDMVVDFGATDAFLTDAEMAEFNGDVIHIPTCMGAVVVAYNLDGVEGLRMTADLISKIYRGEITNWKDPAIAAVNPDLQFPDLAITPVYRSDGSGTTSVFSHYMASVDAAWADVLGEGKALAWQHGVAGKGNPGVAGILSQTKGAFGYVGSEYAFAMQLPSAYIQNQAGEFVLPTTTSISAAADQEMADDTRSMITNAPGAASYPISCLTWIIIYKEQKYADRSPEQAKATIDLLRWMLGSDAQQMTESVNYVRLPASLVAKANARLNLCVYDGNKIE